MKTLFFGFGPFSEFSKNPSGILALECSKNNHNAKSIILPSSFKTSWLRLEKEIKEFNPDIIVGFGLAAGRKTICLEKLALNYKRISKTKIEKIDKNNIVGFENPLNLEKMAKKMRSKKIKAMVSLYAGTFVCNFTYYELLKFLEGKRTKCIFMHIPRMSETKAKSLAKKLAVDTLIF